MHPFVMHDKKSFFSTSMATYLHTRYHCNYILPDLGQSEITSMIETRSSIWKLLHLNDDREIMHIHNNNNKTVTHCVFICIGFHIYLYTCICIDNIHISSVHFALCSAIFLFMFYRINRTYFCTTLFDIDCFI